MGQLYGWMHQLPVIGFNSGKYDINAIKQFLTSYFLSTSKTEDQEKGEDRERRERWYRVIFFIKRNNTFMCLSKDQLKFLDMTNYIAPGFSYDKYLKAYGCEITKDHFSEPSTCLWSVTLPGDPSRRAAAATAAAAEAAAAAAATPRTAAGSARRSLSWTQSDGTFDAHPTPGTTQGFGVID